MKDIGRLLGFRMLKVRLERMERRMSLLKQRKEFASTPERLEASPSLPVVAPSSSSTVKSDSKENKHLFKANHKRPHGSSGLSDVSVTRTDVAACILEPTLDHPWSTALILPKTEMTSSTIITTASSTPLPASISTTPHKSPHKVSSSRTPQKGRGKGRLAQEGMHTRQLYPLPLSYVRPEPELARVESSHIEVPRWRFHPVTSCYQLEGTENLDDDIFFRRHHKLEIDEKRRKRWDMQRIREQRHNEKLRRGRERKNLRCRGKDQGDLSTFFPELRDVQFVEVSETVPVVAFGCTFPQIPSSEFSLDWLPSSRSGLRAEDQQATPSGRKHSRAGSTVVSIKKET